MSEPQVGVFWWVRDRLVIDEVPLSDAEPYGEHLTYPRGHDEVWRQWQREGKVQPESVYEEFPRGRVMFHQPSGEFVILADRCILDRKDLIAQIEAALNLPHEIVKTGTDLHYRCHRCLYGDEADEDWED